MRGLISIYLDAFRFLAALGVLLWHAEHPPVSTGVLPTVYFNHKLVIIFFVISGYVIAASASRPDRTFANYAADRLSRLYSVVIPALVITYGLDAIGTHFSPDVYADVKPQWQSIRLLANLFYCQQIWFFCLNPSSNNPFWSLGYEFWYYVLFGVFIFVKSARNKTLLLLAISLFIGPKILLLLPAWALGALAFHFGQKFTGSFRTNVILFVSTGIALVGSLIFERQLGLTNDRLGQPPLYYSYNIWGDNVFALIVAAHFLGCALLSKQLSTNLDRHSTVKVIRWLAGHTFSLYLFHVPVLFFIRAVTQYDPHHPAAVFTAISATLLIIVGLSKVTEEQYPIIRAYARQWMQRIIEVTTARTNRPTLLSSQPKT